MKHWGLFLSLLTVLLLVLVGAAIYTHKDVPVAKKQTIPSSVNQNSLHPCTGNSADRCKGAPSIDFWPAGSEDATNTAYQPVADDTSREIMGRITGTNGNSLLIKTSSNRTFTVAYPVDALGIFNSSIGPNYPVTVAANDMIYVSYSENSNRHETTINPSQISRTNLILSDTAAKSVATFQKY